MEVVASNPAWLLTFFIAGLIAIPILVPVLLLLVCLVILVVLCAGVLIVESIDWIVGQCKGKKNG